MARVLYLWNVSLLSSLQLYYLRILGNGIYIVDLQRRRNESGVPNQFKFWGGIWRVNCTNIHRYLSVFCFTYLPWGRYISYSYIICIISNISIIYLRMNTRYCLNGNELIYLIFDFTIYYTSIVPVLGLVLPFCPDFVKNYNHFMFETANILFHTQTTIFQIPYTHIHLYLTIL